MLFSFMQFSDNNFQIQAKITQKMPLRLLDIFSWWPWTPFLMYILFVQQGQKVQGSSLSLSHFESMWKSVLLTAQNMSLRYLQSTCHHGNKINHQKSKGKKKVFSALLYTSELKMGPGRALAPNFNPCLSLGIHLKSNHGIIESFGGRDY